MGSGKGGKVSWSVAALMVALVAASLALETAAATHVVGGSTGWIIPPNSSFYSDWASTQTFAVGDTLVFNFQTGSHTVDKVTKSGYDDCSTSNLIGSAITTSPASVPLTTAGDHYFICGIPGHCSASQKLSVTVASSPTGASPPTSAAGPSPPGTDGSSAATSLLSGFRTAATFSLATALVFAASFFLL
ncbi:cucumber peeling cupredoxin-like [Phoenix dactylifera]|uniref:Cucumber peeling cupredoxin n=1 Tax=Phoenix dactylifera TaxID=42345 RepID=F6LP58_PHODC|nr:cucumber peeling cupredoxin [Phoenix dactylifera]XP_038974962.1 cucumber peeling cupredoxin-like [Phoenix dactylifera]XP_038986458.1 cucumber peeling cupredoxin-like [Phoenix dactylifera]AEG74553.1 hypothetical protein [Phoenix dactylifera]